MQSPVHERPSSAGGQAERPLRAAHEQICPPLLRRGRARGDTADLHAVDRGMTRGTASVISTRYPRACRFSAISNPTKPLSSAAAQPFSPPARAAAIASMSGILRGAWARGLSIPGKGLLVQSQENEKASIYFLGTASPFWYNGQVRPDRHGLKQHHGKHPSGSRPDSAGRSRTCEQALAIDDREGRKKA